MKVSVIILNWNGIDYIGECIDSILNQSFRDFELIVADNGSVDGSLEMIKSKYCHSVKIVENEVNLGYAAGNNRAIEKASGDWIALFNNDAKADRFWLQRLIEAVESAKGGGSVGMAASKILFYDRRDVIDNTGHLIYPDGLNRGRGRLERDTGSFDDFEEALFPSGCAGLYRREMLTEIGLLDEDFFAYGEDADIGLRGRLYGWRCIYVPEARVYHRYSAGAGAYSPLKAYHVERNRVWVLVKNFPLEMILMSPLYSMSRYFFQAFGALSGIGAAGRFTESVSGYKLLKTLLKALFDSVRGLRKMTAKRRDIIRKAKISPEDMKRLLKKHKMGLIEISLKD